MKTCVHRVFSDPERDKWDFGTPCHKLAVAFSIHPVTGERLYWCAGHAGERDDVQPIEIKPIDAISEYYESKREDLRKAQEALDAAIDKDAPYETIRRLTKIRDNAAYVGD